MGCITWGTLEQLMIAAVIIIVLVAIVKLVIPAVLSAFGAPPGGGTLITILGYIMWGIAAIFCIIIVFDLLSCAFGSGPYLNFRH